MMNYPLKFQGITETKSKESGSWKAFNTKRPNSKQAETYLLWEEK